MKQSNHCSLTLLYLVVFLIMLIFNSTFTLLPLYLIEKGGTAFLAGLQTAVFFIASILLRFYFGPLADRIGRKWPLLIGIACFSLSSFLFTITMEIWQVTLVRLIQAVGLSAFLSSSMSAVADLAPPGKLGAVMGTYRLVSTLSLLVGPALAMETVRISSYATWFLVCTLMGILAILMLIAARVKSGRTGHSQASALLMWQVLWHPHYRVVLGGIALTAVSYGALLSFAPLQIRAVTNIANPGLYFVLFGFSSLLFTFLSGHLSDKLGRAAVAWPCLMILGSGVAVLAFLRQGQFSILLVSSLLTGIGFNGGLSVLSAWLVDLTDHTQRATVLSVQESIIDFSIGFIAFLFGSITLRGDFSVAFFGTGILITGFGTLLLLRQGITRHPGGRTH